MNTPLRIKDSSMLVSLVRQKSNNWVNQPGTSINENFFCSPRLFVGVFTHSHLTFEVVLYVKVSFVSGKILTDETPVSECNIDDKKFIVVMVSKPKAAPAAYR